ncbi:hypothetical protein NIE88_08695 [Sporolactobacillus shoreicorticis]|uniref:Uncharacterized protein n=1 Tax=Sporolactobacillus shoreicorticis TaxID=1923877 RepID=A0ABW5S2W6_9BACL|nr:hypothetical protein [Sporolactobacillus shoreicorticis]MCO7125848.1 hypothetical protein [Sporolactobacillus shoreicorticis]
MALILGRLDLEARGIWYPLLFSAFVILFVVFMKKRHLTWRQIYATFGMVCSLSWIADISSAIYFDAFRYGTDHGIGIADLLSITFIPAGLAIIYLNYRSQSNKWLMLILFTVLSFGIEFASIQVKYFHLINWELFYSVFIYLFIYGCLLPLHKRVIASGFSSRRQL